MTPKQAAAGEPGEHGFKTPCAVEAALDCDPLAVAAVFEAMLTPEVQP